MKRTLSAVLVLSMLVCSFLFVSTDAASERGEMLMRTEGLDTSWKSVAANGTVNIIGNAEDKIDTLIREKTPNQNQATTHASQNSSATASTLWMLNTNTWAYGYVIEIAGLKDGESVVVTAIQDTWGHDHSGTQGGGWGNSTKDKFTLPGNGVYTILSRSQPGQKSILRPDRVFTLWCKNYQMTFNKAVEVRFLAQVEAVSEGTHHTDADFSSPAYVTYHDKDGKVVETVETDVTDGVGPRDTTYRAIETPELDYDLPDYKKDGITYTLIGWSDKPGDFMPRVKCAYGTMDVYPVYEATGVPFVTFMSEDGEDTLGRSPIIKGVTTSTSLKPEKAGDEKYQFIFDGWVDAEGKAVDITKLTADTTVYASFRKELNDLTVTYVSRDGKTTLGTETVKYGGALKNEPLATLPNTKYQSFTFERWVTMKDEIIDTANITEDVTLRPQFSYEFINPFKDVKLNDWYGEALENTVINGIMNGTDTDKFEPNGKASRAMLATVLYRLEGSPDVSSLPETPFTDVKKGTWYYDAVKWAYNLGVVNGMSAKKFQPDTHLTREQFATMIYRYAKDIRYYDMTVIGGDLGDYLDDGDVSSWAVDALMWMTQESRGYINGFEIDGKAYLKPADKTTRAQMATILTRFGEEREKLAEEFANPSAEYTPIPFWFWNDTLTNDEIERQIRAFHEKGVDGFCIHPRLGLDPKIEYMGEEWLGFVRFAVELADELGMYVLLYDEAMYPSGSCCGQVVAANEEYASRGLRMSTTNNPAKGDVLIGTTQRDGKTYYFFEGYNDGRIRGTYFGQDDGQANAPKASDLLNPDAVAKFIELTHEKYKEALSEYFGTTVIGIFTDEPSINGRRGKAEYMVWGRDFHEKFFAAGYTEDDLYTLYIQATSSNPGGKVYESFKKILNAELREVYYGALADWCEEAGIALTGHPGGSMDINFLQEFDIPCQDIVWRYIYPGNGTSLNGEHSTMGKCASDSARHTGARRNGNETCGVCYADGDSSYYFDEDDMKFYLDYLFSRGCNFVIPHAFYYSVEGARGDERPPHLGMNGYFWDEWDWLSAYIKRCSAMNTDSVNITDIAVLCKEDYLPSSQVKALYESQIEFNYLETDLLDKCTIVGGAAKIQRQSYRIIITTESSYDAATTAWLKEFKEAGGIVIDARTTGGSRLVSKLEEQSLYALDIDAHNDLRLTRVRKYGEDVVFLSNEGEGTIKTIVHEKVKAIWDAKTGKMYENFQEDLELTLKTRESIYLILG